MQSVTDERDLPEDVGLDLANEIEIVIGEYADKHDPFTAHTVTCKLREKFEDVEIVHSQVRDLVEDMFNVGADSLVGYERARSHFKGNPYIYMYTG